MKPSTILFLAVNCLGLTSATAIPSTEEGLHTIQKRSCFATGAKFGDQKKAALDAAKTACNGGLKGTYHKRETRVKCYNIGGNKHVKLTVGLTGKNAGSTRNIGYSECLGGLQSEIDCEKGGDTTYGNWRYRADPNNGAC